MRYNGWVCQNLFLQDRCANIRAKSMPATATTLVQSIWKNYFCIKGLEKENAKATEEDAPEDETAGDTDLIEYETAIQGGNITESAFVDQREQFPSDSIQPTGLAPAGDACDTYKSFLVYTTAQDAEMRTFACGVIVRCLRTTSIYSSFKRQIGQRVKNQEWGIGSLGMIQCFLKDKRNGKHYVQLRTVLTGQATVLGDAASTHELFLENRWIIM